MSQKTSSNKSSRKIVLTNSAVAHNLKEFPSWIKKAGGLTRTFEFGTYLEGLRFANRLGREANGRDHHPQIVIAFKKVQVCYSTHSAGGITELDFDGVRLANELSRRHR